MKFGKKTIIRTHPQPRAAKRLCLRGVKPVRLTNFTTLSAIFPKAQRSQSEAKKGADIEVSGTARRQKSKKKQHPQKIKNKPRENSRSSDLGAQGDYFFAVRWSHFCASSHPGTNMVPVSSPRAPGTAQTPLAIDCFFDMAVVFSFFSFGHGKI